MERKKDIMDSILRGHAHDTENRVDQLNCLIYKNDKSEDHLRLGSGEESVWQASKDNVSVQVWEGRAKIKVKVSPGKNKKISMKRIASIAMDAILEELKKED